MSGYDAANSSTSALRKRKTLKKSINFSIMIIGESGMGRSTLINTLCGGDSSTTSIVPTSTTLNQDPFTKQLSLRHENVELEDNDGHKINLNIIDTPNFANSINCQEDFKIIVDFIRHQFDEVLLEESRVRRNPRFKDGRIHVVVYMINPTSHGLSNIDKKLFSSINNLVNIIPVIAKADSLTIEELKLNKQLILQDLQDLKINYYKFNEYEYEQDYIDEEIIEYNKYLNSLTPFAIIGANESKGDLKLRILGRNTQAINVENPDLNDFTILKNVLLITHLNEFKDLTHDVIYENYRTEALSGKEFQYGDEEETTTTTPAMDSSEVTEENTTVPESNYLMKEEQIKLEEERLKKFEERVHQDLINKRKELLEKELELKEIEKRLKLEGVALNE
ncbi:Septin CDC11 [Spathaspora sp. JA1]|nr:Septin CDC11 [Spathaspora sp. JA1]